MIKWIKVRNPYNEELTVTLTEAEPSHGLIVKEITGLGAHASLSFTDYAILDGSVNTNIRLEKRTIGITFLLTFAPDIETSRQNVYHFMPIKSKIRLWIGTDKRTRYIDGLVESIEPGIFSENEEVNVSIVCEDPYFRSDRDTVHDMNLEKNLSEFNKNFEFPFENNSLTEKKILLNDGIKRTSPHIPYTVSGVTKSVGKLFNVRNNGDLPVGFVMRIYFNGRSGNYDKLNTDLTNLYNHLLYLRITNTTTNERFLLNLYNVLQSINQSTFDEDTWYAIEICSVKKNKYVKLYYNQYYGDNEDCSWIYKRETRSTLDAIAGVDTLSEWLALVPGLNNIIVDYARGEQASFISGPYAWEEKYLPAWNLLSFANLYQGV